jgi:hypothetical protein
MRQHETTIEAIVGDEFRERFSWSPENEMMQFDDWERCRDRTIRCDAHGHFAFDREAGEVVEIQDVTVFPNLTLEKATSDRPLHAELLHCARPGATNLVADQTITSCDPKLRNSILELIGFGE